jgi:imidazoleglycerol-phosphate dehydratase
LGEAFAKALGDKKGLRRFGHAYAPLDEALARAVIDISSRPFFCGEFGFRDQKIGALSTQMIHHGLQSFSQTAGVTLHVDVLKGDNDHHRAEAAFKALAVATRQAIERVAGKEGEVISTKGVL